MHTSRFSRSARRALPALLGLLLIFGATDAPAREFEAVNTPPVMPEAMRQMETTAAKPFNALPVGPKRPATVGGGKVTVHESLGNDVGFAVPETSGGYVWIPAPAKSVRPGVADAREMRLKVRELASQLIAGMDPSLRGMVALPTSFVNQEDFTRTSPLGRFMAEQLMYEFNQRGFPVREYRMAPQITSREGEGEFLLSRNVAPIPVGTAGVLFVVGTYFVDHQAVFINARLVRGNGTVLRTAQLVLPNSAMTRRMLAGAAKALPKGKLPIRDYRTTTQPTNLTPFDRGEDIH